MTSHISKEIKEIEELIHPEHHIKWRMFWIKLVQILFSLSTLISIIVYCYDLWTWYDRELFTVLVSSISLFVSLVFIGLIFMKSKLNVFRAIAVIDTILAIFLLVAAILETTQFGVLNQYGLCSMRIPIMEYIYYINCRALTATWVFGYLTTLSFLYSVLYTSSSLKHLRY